MWHNIFRNVLSVAALAALTAVPAGAQDGAVIGFSVSASKTEARIAFQLVNGDTRRVALLDGRVRVDNEVVGRYTPDGRLEREWRAFLAEAGTLSTEDVIVAARTFAPTGLSASDAESAAALGAVFRQLELAASVPLPPTPPTPPAPPSLDAVIATATQAALAGAAAESVGDVAEIARDAREAARSLRESLRTSIREGIRNEARQNYRFNFDFQDGNGSRASVRATTPVEGIWNGLLGVTGSFLALLGVAFGASFFANRQLDIVADTVQTSFARSFFVGLFAQPLILPAFAMMVVGLTLTVVGVLVVPVAIVAFIAALAAAIVGGYLAVARVTGATFLARKQRDHGLEGLGVLRSLAYGIAILLAIWLPAVALAWAPVAGPILKWTAVALTWAMVTTGFGASILTRGGLRGTFGRRFAPRPVTPDTLFAETGEAVAPEISTAEWLAQGKW